MDIKDTEFISIDIETTGLSSTSRIIEIGAVKFFPWGRTIAEFNQLIHPGIEIPENVIGIHGITNEMVEDKPYIAEIMPDLIDFIGNNHIFAHNSGFDFLFLTKAGDETGYNLKNNLVFDTLKLSRAAFPGIKHNLNFLTQFFALKVKGKRHRALTDAFLAAQLFEICVDKLNINTCEELIDNIKPRIPDYYFK